MTENDDVVILWEAPKIVPPEFRLYYDEKGKVICYTCEKLEGNYIIIDALTYAEGRPDIRVIDGKIVKVATNVVITKLVPDDDQGKICAREDISILPDTSYIGKKTKWKLNLYEL
jgi:hypothetical protein